MDEELVFDTKGLDEKQYIAYTQGIIDALERLGFAFVYDECDPDFTEYQIKVGRREQCPTQ